MQEAKVRGKLREEEGWREKCKLNEKIQLINKKNLKTKGNKYENFATFYNKKILVQSLWRAMVHHHVGD